MESIIIEDNRKDNENESILQFDTFDAVMGADLM